MKRLWSKIRFFLKTGRWPRRLVLTPKGRAWAEALRNGAFLSLDEHEKLKLNYPDEK